MPTYTQAHQPLAVTTALGPDALLLTRLEGAEALSQPFHFSLSLLAESAVAFDALLGHPATVRLSIPGCPPRHINGILSSLDQGHRVQGAKGGFTFIEYQAELVPTLWLLGLRQQSRVFQDLSVPDILRQVLHTEWSLDVSPLLTATYPARDYCVQYRETDLAFVSRLMEEEGICYYFTHTDSQHTLVLADSADGHPDLAGQSSLIFDAAVGGRRPEGRVTLWHKRQELRSTKVTLRDYSFQVPASTLEAGVPILDKVQVGQVSHSLKHPDVQRGKDLLEIYDYPGRYAWRFDGVGREGSNQPDKVQGLFQENGRVAHLRMEEEATPAVRIDGASLCGHLLPGCKISLTRHFDGDGPYLLTRVAHHADLTSAYLSDPTPAGRLYDNRFEAMPAALPFRPPRLTPKPTIAGVQTATVVGPPGNDIFVDKYGRVKVKFHWDRRLPSGPEDSCWLRVGQVWAGKRWGAYFWPRVGHEVVVSFVEGDPDRPLITGSVYNEANMPPFALPDNRTLAGIKSFTSTGNPSAQADPLSNYNGFLFNDAVGKEQLELHGERHIAFYGEQSHLHTVDGWHRLNVNGTHSTHVGQLPFGGGSGGGPLNDSESPPYIHSAKTQGGKIGAQLTSVCGVNQTINIGQFGRITAGEEVTIVVNPVGMATDLGWAINAGVLGPVLTTFGSVAGGVIGVVMGTHATINYGAKVSIVRGGVAAVTDCSNWRNASASTAGAGMTIATNAVAAATAVLATVGLGLAAASTYDTKQIDWEILTGTAAILSGTLYLLEVGVAFVNQATKAAQAGEAAVLAESVSGLTLLADVLETLFDDDHKSLNHALYNKGTTTEYNDGGRILGGKDLVMLFAGDEEEEQSALTLVPGTITLATMEPVVGPRMAVDKTAIFLKVGPTDLGTAIRLNEDTVTLSSGPVSQITITDLAITFEVGVSKLTITDESITLLAGGNTLTLNAAGLSIESTGVDILTVDYKLETMTLNEVVSGEAQRELTLEEVM